MLNLAFLHILIHTMISDTQFIVLNYITESLEKFAVGLRLMQLSQTHATVMQLQIFVLVQRAVLRLKLLKIL